ncbi:DUF2726 domain-containing protein [Vibrio anguillarum]|uniref:DUF2726 domain-containing protein n=1 Tax=Vibrio anguillarum TaxID=55601 RepID=UPI0009B66AAA|nr:DUF2726 domain-containing protein [Vibrio anguillarum]
MLTPAEHNFYKVLERVLPSGYIVTFKVRIGDVLKVRKGIDKKRAFVMRGKVQQKHFDFVICRLDDMKVACCIELNDASHNRRDRAKRDAFVRSACKAAGVTLLEVENRRSYVIDDIREMVKAAIQGEPVNIPDSADIPEPERIEHIEVAKLSSSKLAKQHGYSTDGFMLKLVESMYLEVKGDEYQLTEFGMNIGGEEKRHPRYGKFFVWPEDLPFA